MINFKKISNNISEFEEVFAMNVPAMPGTMKLSLKQKATIELYDEELEVITEAYRMFFFHVLRHHPIEKTGSIAFVKHNSKTADIVIQIPEVRKLIWFNDDDSPLYYIVIERLCLFFYGGIPEEADFVNTWRKKMLEIDEF